MVKVLYSEVSLIDSEKPLWASAYITMSNSAMHIKTQEELFKGPVKIRHLSEKAIKISKMFIGENIKVIFDGELKRKNDIVEIRGTIFADKVVECIRCLEKFNITVSEEIRINLKPSYMLPRDEEIELSLSDLDDDFYEQDEIDFYEYMIPLGESIIPPYNLCSENCRGICKVCGENLNKVECRCSSGGSEKVGAFEFVLNKDEK